MERDYSKGIIERQAMRIQGAESLNRTIKSISLISFLSLSIALLIILITPKSSGYEISIYQAFPIIFWLFLIISIGCGITILAMNIFGQNQKSDSWRIGFIAIIVTNLIIMLIPFLRGYFLTNPGDAGTHLGMIKDIDISGYFSSNDIYPLSHLFVSEVSNVSGIESRLIMETIPLFFYLIYLIGTYLLTRILTKNKGIILLVLSFASILQFGYFNYLFLPTQFVLYLIPLTLFLILKTGRIDPKNRGIFKIAFFLFLVPLPFLHPLGTILSIVLLALYGFAWRIKKRLVPMIETGNGNSRPENALMPAALLMILLFFWFSRFNAFDETTSRAYDWFAYGIGTIPLERISGLAQVANLTAFDIVSIILKTYGHIILITFLSLIGCALVLKDIVTKRMQTLPFVKIFFSISFVTFSLIFSATLISGFIVTGASLRLYCWALMSATILNGVVYYERINSIKKKILRKVLSALIVTSIFAASIMGVATIFPSPFINQQNLQVSEMNWIGMDWYFDHKSNITTIYFNEWAITSRSALYGFELSSSESFVRFHLPPNHFGYDNYSSISYTIDSDSYIVIDDMFREAKMQLWPDKGSITWNDLEKLKADSAVMSIFSNGDLEVYMAYST